MDLPAISASETLAAQLSQRGIKNNSLTGTLPDHQPRYKVGDTPVLDISFLSQNPKVTILGKCEFANPTGSIKDRMVSYVLERAVAEGKLKPGLELNGRPRWQVEKELAKKAASDTAASNREKNEALMAKYGCTDQASCVEALKKDRGL